MNTALRRASAGASKTFEEIASRDFTLVRDTEVVFDVIQRMSRKAAIMAVVMQSIPLDASSTVAGVITKEHIADSIANTLAIYPE